MAVDSNICMSPDRQSQSSSYEEMPFSASERLLREKLGLGEFGLALFVPIDEELFPILYYEPRESEDKHDTSSDSSPRDIFLDGLQLSDGILEHDESPLSTGDQQDLCDQSIPVYIEPPEDPTELLFAPRIIADEMLQQIVNEALPYNLQMFTTWKRLFSISLHGDCISTMLNRCKLFRYTLLVVKTSNGNIIGGFASEPWEGQGGIGKCTYYGRGASFLFSDFPPKPDRKLTFYKWVGANDYCQLCDVQAGRLALGGGGNFGLVVDNNFQKGTTGSCATFNNPSLVPGIGGSFDVVEFEVYGIVPLMETLHFREQ